MFVVTNATLSVSNPQPSLSYEWYDAASGGGIVGTGTTFTVNNVTNPINLLC